MSRGGLSKRGKIGSLFDSTLAVAFAHIYCDYCLRFVSLVSCFRRAFWLQKLFLECQFVSHKSGKIAVNTASTSTIGLCCRPIFPASLPPSSPPFWNQEWELKLCKKTLLPLQAVLLDPVQSTVPLIHNTTTLSTSPSPTTPTLPPRRHGRRHT